MDLRFLLAIRDGHAATGGVFVDGRAAPVCPEEFRVAKRSLPPWEVGSDVADERLTFLLARFLIEKRGAVDFRREDLVLLERRFAFVGTERARTSPE
jgi:hypothetical protein